MKYDEQYLKADLIPFMSQSGALQGICHEDDGFVLTAS